MANDFSVGVTGLLRHMPQRVHDQEKLYSPALKTIVGGYSYLKAERERIERQRLENCREHEEKYNEAIKLYMDESSPIRKNASLEDFNELIGWLNNYYGDKGCPSLPKLEAPTFATKR